MARVTSAGSAATKSPARTPVLDQPAQGVLVAIALAHDPIAQRRRERFDLQVRGRALDLVEQRAHVRGEHRVQPARRPGPRPGPAATAASIRSSARSWQ